MKKFFFFSLVILLLSSCSKLKDLSADNFDVVPNPLETKGGEVPVTINGNFPKKYMKKKATVTVTPELRYGAGESSRAQSETFQGEKVQGNNETISYEVGGNYTMKSSFKYIPEMHKSDLYLTFDATLGKKSVTIPAVKVAEGIIATSELYTLALDKNAFIAPDSFQRVREERQVAQVKFLVNQANLRKSELQNNSVTEFVKLLKEINNEQEKLNLKNVEVLAYASPEGTYKRNDELANQRRNVAEDYVNEQLKNAKVSTEVTSGYTAEDWEGFQQLVAASNIQDKDVILRVLSMYTDPEERERQIRNMSEGYQELASGILPELRRSRMIINYEVIGRSDNEIQEQYKEDPSKLSVEELLYAATLTNDEASKEDIYKKITSVYPDDYRAYNNIAALEIEKGNYSQAKDYLEKSLSVDSKAAEANENLGLLALKNGNLDEAQDYIAKASDASSYNQALGILRLAQGDYSAAAESLQGTDSDMTALAQILCNNYSAATTTLDAIKDRDALTDYLEAILNARQGNSTDATKYLNSAIEKDPSLKTYAEEDLEFK